MDGTVYKSIHDRCSLEFINGGYLLQVRSSGGLFRDNIIHPTLRMALLGATQMYMSYMGRRILYQFSLLMDCIVFERDLSYTPMRASLSLQFAFLFN